MNQSKIMKHSKHIFFLLLACMSLTLMAQTRALKKANKFYGIQAYSQAIPFYEKSFIRDSSNKITLSNLADCYRLTNNTTGELKCYSGLLKTGKAEPIHMLYYGQALMKNGQKNEAEMYLEEYTIDNRGKELASSIEKTKQYTKNADAYKVDLCSFNSPQSDFCAVVFNNTIVFSSTRDKTKWINEKHGWTNESYLNLYAAEKKEGKDIEPKIFMRDLSSKYNDGPVCFAKVNNTVYFTRNNSGNKFIAKDGTYKLKILEATMKGTSITKITEPGFNNKDYNCAHPSITADGKSLYFASDMPGGFGGMDIYVCTKNSDGTYGKAENLGNKVNTAGNEVFPFIAANGLLYFSSNGHDGMGGLDIYETKIKQNKAERIYNMGEPVNSKDDDFGVFLGDDSKNGYLSSNRKNTGMDDDIYSLQILREVKRGREVLIVTKDKASGEILANTFVKINNEAVTTNEKGEYLTTVEEGMNYDIVVEKTDYYKLEDKLSTKNSPDELLTKTLLLEKDPKLALLALVTDAKTNAPLEGVKITIKELPGNEAFDTYTTAATGDYRKPLKGKKIGDKISYSIVLEKATYLTKTLTFIYDIKKPGDINVNESLDMKLGKVEVGGDLAKMIDIKPIYFDLGKFTIRKDAAAELDKIAAVMKEYPNMSIELGSHSDCRGAAKANLTLSDKRAKASAAYIIKKGIEKTRIVGKGYGELKLLNSCMCEGKVLSTCPEDEHSKNRRTEFIITKLN